MLSLEVGGCGRSSNLGGSSSMIRPSREEADRLRAMSSGLTLGLDTSATSSFMARQQQSARREEETATAMYSQRPLASFPMQLDLLPRAPSQPVASQTGSAPPVSCISQLTRHSLLSSGINMNSSNTATNDCCEEMAAPETHSTSSRGGAASPSPRRGIDMNEIPADGDDHGGVCSPRSCSISPSNGAAFAFDIAARKGESSSVNIKRERERSDAEADRTNCEVSSRGSDEEDGAPRKKLRLSKEQSALLEESFKEHSTLNPKQKNALAKQLNLRPRQVEVWFQNRRARTKLKQTEIDCELLKRCCETLTEENRRLQKELTELRAIKVAPPCVISQDFYMPLPAATLTMCPSCERLAAVDNRSNTHLPSPFPKSHQAASFAHFPPQPPAACQS